MPNPPQASFPPFYVDLPYTLVGWIGWLGLLGLILTACLKLREENYETIRQRWMAFVALAILGPILAVLIPIRIPYDQILPIPGLPVETRLPVIFLLAGICWVLAAGLVEPVWACLVGAITGLAIGFIETHHLFSLIEYAGLALLMSFAVRQRYRTRFFKLLRHPLGAGAFLAFLYAPVYILTAFFATNGPMVARIDYAITQTWPLMLTRAAEMLLGCLVAEGVMKARPALWGHPGPWVPSPFEKSLQLRFFTGTAPLVFLLFFSLTIGDWLVAGNAARNMIRDRISNTTNVAANSLPYFLETGQNLLVTLGDSTLLSQNAEQLKASLGQRVRSVPYFRQLTLLNAQGQPISGYPKEKLEEILLTEEEKSGIDLALKGVMVQTYIVPGQGGENNSVQVSFLAPVRNSQNQILGVLLGRTDLDSNPFSQPAIQALNTVKDLKGDGYILDENGRILYHSNPEQIMSDYRMIGKIPGAASFFEEISGVGTRQLVYFEPMLGKGWSVILTVPAEQAQQLALSIAIPLLIILAILATLSVVALRFGLRPVTQSMKSLSQEATLISQGQLEHGLQVNGVDEVGQFSRAFEQMRVSLKARLDELNRLLRASQGVAANLEAGDALRPVLESALGEGALLARIALMPEAVQDLSVNRPAVFGVGPAANQFSYMDEQIFDLMRSQEIMAVPNTNRVRRLMFHPGLPQPGALVALALHHENRYMGALWIAYEQPRNFSDEELRFLGTLSSQAAVAVSNTLLYATAEIGRQRLEAVLVSTPEPVLVFDEQTRLLLLNSAALQVAGLVLSAAPGRPIQETLAPKELVGLIVQPQEEKLSSCKVNLPNGKVYFASVSAVVADGRPVGKVCVLQDITHFTELDKLKSDFVATVSHDLRSPLTLMRGYVTMLQMVGELNEQQKNYTRKIIVGVENMTRLVNNLLDLGRIDAGIGLQIERVLAQEVIELVIGSLQPQATQKNIQLTHEGLDQPPVYLEVDRALLQQAIYNLVENAIKYTTTSGQVRVRLQVQPNHVVFEVHDTGIGIAPLDLPRLFERFYRSTRREAHAQRGTGLGLAIVKSIAERHGGRVWVESQLGKGSIFCLEVPLFVKKVENSKAELTKPGGDVL